VPIGDRPAADRTSKETAKDDEPVAPRLCKSTLLFCKVSLTAKYCWCQSIFDICKALLHPGRRGRL